MSIFVRNNLYARAMVGVVLASAVLLSILAPREVYAHHSPAGFDTGKNVTLTGVVTKYEWFNPHVYITIEAPTDQGAKREWQVECFAPSMMGRLGWSKETLHAGDVLAISGSPSRDPSANGFLALKIERADVTLMQFSSMGKEFAASQNAPMHIAKSLVGTWLTDANMRVIAQVVAPPTSQLTPEGARLFKTFDEKAQHPLANCVPATSPSIMAMPDMKRISVDGDELRITTQSDGTVRTVHLNATHDGAIPSHQGDSIGRWEGKTLVIDTTHFAYHRVGNGLGVPSGPKKHLIERLTPSADGASLVYSFEVEDPEYLKGTRTNKITWVFRPDLKFAIDPCNLDSARRFISY